MFLSSSHFVAAHGSFLRPAFGERSGLIAGQNAARCVLQISPGDHQFHAVESTRQRPTFSTLKPARAHARDPDPPFSRYASPLAPTPETIIHMDLLGSPKRRTRNRSKFVSKRAKKRALFTFILL